MGCQIPRVHAVFPQQGQVARQRRPLLISGDDASTGNGLKRLHLLRLHARLSGVLQNSLGQRMLRRLFHRSGEGQQSLSLHSGGGYHVRGLGPALGDGSCLIQRHHVHRFQRLQGLGGFNQHPVFGAFACSHHNSGGGGQAQRAGTGDHQHRNADRHSEFKALSCQQPSDAGRQGDGDDCRHKHAADFIRQLGDGSFAGAGLLHQANNLSQGRILADFVRSKFQKPSFVDGGARHPLARPLFHRNALAGEGRFVHSGGTFHHNAVYRQALAGPHHNDIPHLHLFHRDFLLSAFPLHYGGFGRQVH